MPKNLLTGLRDGMPSFSKGQKKIALYMIEHYDKAAFMTAAKLGDTVGVSESTVVRFAAELGYDGYPTLQKTLQELIRSRLTTVQRLDFADGPIDGVDIPARVMNMDGDRIRQTLELLDRKSFDRAVNEIVSAKRIFILGVRSSKLLAGFLAFYFNHIFDNVSDVGSSTTGEVFEAMLHITKGDVLLAMSFPRYSQRTLKAAQFAKDSGAFVIGITDSNSAPLSSVADILLVAHSEMASVVDSLVAPLSLLNAIVVAASYKKRGEVTDSYAKLEKIWSEYNVYENVGDQ